MALSLLLLACHTTSGDGALDQVLVKRSQMLMGTLVFVTAVAEDDRTAKGAAAAGLSEIRRLEQLLSTWIPTSELSRVNAAAGNGPVAVSSDTYNLVERSLAVGQLTDGAFNIAIGPAVTLWGFYGEFRIPAEAELESVRERVDLSNIQLDSRTRTISLERPDMRIDVGGIGKGFAADRAVEAMREAGATAGVVALSGDIKTFGRMPDGQRFLFGIQHPRREDAILGKIELEDEAVSTAGDYQRFFMVDGVRYHHVIDTVTLRPAVGCQSVSVIAREGVLADGLDTGIFVMGPSRGMELVERLDDVEAVIVDQSGEVLVSSGLQGRLLLEEQVPSQEP